MQVKEFFVLRFFRLNDPYRLLGVLLLMIAISLPMLFGPIALTLQELKDMVLGEALNDGRVLYLQLIDDSPWLAALFAKWIEFIFGRSLSARHLFALLILFFQASYFALALIRNKAYNESNYLAALIFAILCFFSFDMLSLSRELIASTFLLFALNILFKEIEFKVQRDETVLNIGVFIGIASLFVFSYALFLLGALVILYAFARISLRKALLVVFGFVFPHSLLFCLYFFRDGLPQLCDFFYNTNFTFHTIAFVSWKSLVWLGGVILLFFFFSLVMLNREARFTRYQSQLLQVMMLWVLIATIQITITRERTPHSFITFIPPLTYFISHYILLIRRKWIAEIMLWVFLFSVLGVSFAARAGKIKAVDYSNLFVPASANKSLVEKKVLVLADDWGSYENNKVGSYFLNWDLSKEIFEHPEFYENIILINESFQSFPPDVIIDRNGLMEKVFVRLPLLKTQYQIKVPYSLSGREKIYVRRMLYNH